MKRRVDWIELALFFVSAAILAVGVPVILGLHA